MEFFLKKELSEEEIEAAEQFYSSLPAAVIEQHPLWASVLGNKSSISYFLAYEKSSIRCFSVIEEKDYRLLKTARIPFGPLFREPNDAVESIREIIRRYKTAGYHYLAIQLGLPVGDASEYIEYALSNHVRFKQVFDRHNWSSLGIDLRSPVEDIVRSFSKGHKSAVKKATGQGVRCRPLQSIDEVEQFSQISDKMNLARGLGTSGPQAGLFKRVYGFLKEKELGVFLGVFDNQDVMVGGIVVIFQGDTARYYKGASDPDRKDIAVLHVAIVEAIRIAKESGRKILDLWGYNHFVGPSDQVYYINRFKKGFTNRFLFYPKTMHISLRPLGYRLYHLLRNNQKVIRKVANLFRSKGTSK